MLRKQIIAACVAGVLLTLSGSTARAHDEQKYNALITASRQYSRQLEFEEAIALLSSAIKMNPSNYLAYQLRSEAYRELNIYDKAIADLQKANSLSKGNLGLLRDLGYIHFRNRTYKEAVAAYSRAIAIDPTDGGALSGRGRSYMGLKNYEAAARDYKKSLESKTRSVIRAEIEVRGILGDLYLKLKQPKDALEQFNSLITKYPHISKGFYGRAEVYKMQGKPDLAAKDLKAAHELDYEMEPTLKKGR